MSKKKENNLFISLGGCGNAILHSITQESSLINSLEAQANFVNFSSSDLSKDYNGNKLLIDTAGTGRSKEVGEKLVIENRKKIFDFYSQVHDRYVKNSIEDKTIVILSSFGGGTGSSLLPATIDYWSSLGNPKIKVMAVGVLSSPKEGVATLPNGIKTFNEIYNNYLLSGRLNNLVLVDNEKFEESCGVYNFPKMNSIIVSFLEKLLEEDKFHESGSAGYQTLDLKEVKRVLFFGQGICDFSAQKINKPEEWSGIESSIFAGSYKYNTAKAISLLIKVKKKDSECSKDFIDSLHTLAETIKKKTSAGFFVWGLSFGNKTMETEIETQLTINGLDLPKSIASDKAKAVKEVTKLKKKNNEFEIGSKDDLSF